MTIRILLFLLTLVLPLPAFAWNDKGHMVIARLAWRELAPAQRVRIVRMLQAHPHLEEFLQAKRPENIPEDEWLFLRASTWPDWVRSGPSSRRKYHQSSWHYINYPIVAPGSSVTPPPLPDQNILNQIKASRNFIKNGNQEERAIHLCWLCHLIGDLHQPLHCVSFYSEAFPEGDRGGNLAKLRIQNRGIIRLHPFWDGLLGTGVSPGSLNNSIMEIDELMKTPPAQLAENLDKHRLPTEWAEEGVSLARSLIYQDGKLQPANDAKKPNPATLPQISEAYVKESGQAARYCVAKAGKRLAGLLSEILAEMDQADAQIPPDLPR